MKSSIPELNKKLDELSKFFNEKSTVFCLQINKHEGQLSKQDQKEFCQVIDRIKNYANQQIDSYFSAKIESKHQIYDSQITNFTESGEEVGNNLRQFRQQLQQDTLQLKVTQAKKEKLLEHFSQKFNKNTTLKKFWAILKLNRDQSVNERKTNEKMKKIYIKNLLKKSFFPWRRLTYKEGYQNTVIRSTQKDISNIHQQYQSIVNILKQKILETEDLIKLKKSAKGQFAYALSKNLLKTISNLSLEVMSLNQMSLKDGEANENETKQFMKKVDVIITQKLKKAREYKQSIFEVVQQQETKEINNSKKKKKITFIQ